MVTDKALVKAGPTGPVGVEPEKKLAQYRELGYNVVVAAMNLHVTDPRMMQDFKIIQVNPDPKAGEVFETGYNSGKFALQRPALERIAICAGIVWDARETKLLRAEREYVIFQAVGYMRSDSGETITLTGTKEIDMSVVEDEMRAEQTVKVFNDGNKEYRTWNRKIMYEELSGEQQAKVDGLTRREVTVFRKHKLARAETGAKLRAIRSMGLKSSYTTEELRKPFVIVRVVPNPHDPMVRASMRQAALSLYGEGTTRREIEEARAEREAEAPMRAGGADPEDAEFSDPEAPETVQETTQTPDPPTDHQAGQNEAGSGNGSEGAGYVSDDFKQFILQMREFEKVLGVKPYRAVLKEFGSESRTAVPQDDPVMMLKIIQAMNAAANKA